ncbi:DUF4221 family protein [Algoriphagus chordae]|uniref:Uncharacterized protein DUF4221 n=1 Tax=Algoriphagus chordae TaxID=237019 RepID=A0A2W7R8T1_9BACT|nr:DUF4221 family protein [Algoriphagus chordae]PZX47015.1 uncharacterized protein DUF4221 [Algoriphagus chordae]
MTRYLFLLIAITLVGCNSDKKSDAIEAKNLSFSYELDTVHIDSKGTLFFLNNGLMGTGLSPDSNKLYLFNRPFSRLDIVDLEKLEYYDSLPLEPEGPNGIGQMGIGAINITNSGDYYFTVYREIKAFDPSGNLKREIKWTTDEEILSQLENGVLEFKDDRISPDGSTYYGIYTTSNIPEKPQEDGLAIMDLNTKKLKMVDLPSLKKLSEFKLLLEQNGGTIIAGDQTYLIINGSKILISNGAMNVISAYDLELDSLREYSYETELLPAEKPGNYPRKVGTMEEFSAAMEEKNKEPLYGEIHFDPISGYYYRVSFLKEAKPDGNLERKAVLTIFDQELNLIHEEMGDFGISFIRNGSIYRFINIDDEMAFVRLKPNFGND